MLKEDLKEITIKYLFDTGRISARTANCCNYSDLNSLYDLVTYFEKYHSFLKVKIKNAGQKTCLELDNLCKNYISQIEFEKECSDKIEDTLQLIKELTEQERVILLSLAKLIIDSEGKIKKKERLYGHYCSYQFVSDYYQRFCHLPMLWILEQNIKKDNSKEVDILINSYNIFKNHQILTTKELIVKHDICRERIRQIRIKLFYKTFKIKVEHILGNKNEITGLGNLIQNKDDWFYLLEVLNNADIVCHNSIEVQNHLKEEKSNFSNEFFLYFIAYIFKDIYCFFGDIDAQKSDDWNNIFIIKKEYAEIFDFEKLRDEFSNIINKNESDYFLDIEDYVANSQCWIQYDYNKTLSLVKIVREFLLYEFYICSDEIDGYVKIPANKEKKPIDVIYDILYQTGKPMHLNEIFEKFKIILPEHKYTEASQLRPYLQRHEAISYINRKSVYTLKEWGHIKTGTIRDAIVEFLTNNDVPQTAENITEYVLQYFPETNIASVRTTMFNDTQKRFLFFSNNFFGLKSKTYPHEYELYESQEILRKSFEQRLLDLELFIIEEGHYPFTTSVNSKESSLGRWWNRIINHLQQINDSQQEEVDRVKTQYAEYDMDKSIYDWNLNYNKLKFFILENRRLPSTNENEKFLYGWLRRTKEDFQNNNLTEEQRQKYINLAKLI